MAFLPVLALASCGDTPHVHAADAHGFCSCGEYMGETATEFPVLGFIKQWDSLESGEYVFYRAPGKNGHGYHVEDWDEWRWDDGGAELLADFTCFTMKGGVYTPYALVAAHPNETAIEVGADGYVYFALHASAAKSNAMIDVVEDHIYNAAGVCEVEGNFIPTNHNGNHGKVIPVGSESELGISYSNDNKHHYFLIQEDPNMPSLAFGGRKFHVNTTVISADSVKLYYVDAQYKAHELNITEGSEDVVPEGVHKLYVSIQHKADVTNGSFGLARVAE